MTNTLLVATDSRGVAALTINRPAVRNAFDDTLIAAITTALKSCAADPKVRAVTLSGAGDCFSAGGDLAWMQRMADYSWDENLADATALADLMHVLDTLPKPTIAMVNGPAYGGAVGLVACCDIAVAASTARFCLSEVKLGLIPAVISPYVVAAMGARQARRYALTAEVISAANAQRMGLVHEVVEPGGLDAARERILAALFQGGPDAQADAKQLIAEIADEIHGDGLRAETARRIAHRRASPEGREGLAAFLQKRKPAWSRD